jgi:hypothetical protein
MEPTIFIHILAFIPSTHGASSVRVEEIQKKIGVEAYLSMGKSEVVGHTCGFGSHVSRNLISMHIDSLVVEMTLK